jgi:hypothetical protein
MSNLAITWGEEKGVQEPIGLAGSWIVRQAPALQVTVGESRWCRLPPAAAPRFCHR